MKRAYQLLSIRNSMNLFRGTRRSRVLTIGALDLESEEYKSKLKQIQTTHGSKGKKQSIQLKAWEHNLPIEETKAKVIEGKKGSAAGN